MRILRNRVRPQGANLRFGKEFGGVGLEGVEAGVERGHAAPVAAGEFGQPRIGDLFGPLQAEVGNPRPRHRIFPKLVAGMGAETGQGGPGGLGGRIEGQGKMDAEESTFGEESGGEAEPATLEPATGAAVMHVGIQNERHEDVPVKQSGHV